MSRSKTASKMIEYLESTLNCHKVIRFVDQKTAEPLDLEVRVLEVGKTRMNFQLFTFELDHRLYAELVEKFDAMTHANYMGMEYFPYIYGVLNCIEEKTQRTYLFREYTHRSLMHLVSSLQGPQDWYDLALQAAMIDYYLADVIKYPDYSGSMDYFRVIDQEKPSRADYTIEELKITSYHRFRLVFWKTSPLPGPPTRLVETLHRFLSREQIDFNIPKKVLEMMAEISSNPEGTLRILSRYYQWKEPRESTRAD